MKSNYDFSKGIKNPYIKKLKKSITMKLDEDIIKYFKNMSIEKNIPYQSLINLYLRECKEKNKVIAVNWK